MPTLEWIGKKAVVNHHNEVPYHLLKCDPELSVGPPDTGNLIVQGDNLLALKALLPYYAGQVKCIYIDPPYNTGNEGWVYNDNVNAPEIRRWLHKTVGGEAEDLSRHDKWLCMMLPRLRLLKDFLTEDGAIFISIDDNEVASLRAVMDEVFGKRNFVATVIWQKVYAPKNSARHFSEDHDYIVVYAKSADAWKPHLLGRTERQDKAYRNPDNDPRGVWRADGLSARNYYSRGTYAIVCPSGRVIDGPPTGRYWVVSEDTFKEMDADGRIWWGQSGNNNPSVKRFLSEVKKGVVPQTLWTYREAGHTQDAKKELVSIVDFAASGDVFITPKPTRLIRRILQLATDNASLVMDSFAGSGTTGHAVLKQNAEDGGSRRFILVELEENVARNITAERVKRVINGYGDTPGLGGGFRYCVLGEPLFDAEGRIREGVTFSELAQHVFFTETGEPLPAPVDGTTPFIGEARGLSYHLLWNGVPGGNVLNAEALRTLSRHRKPRVVFADGLALPPSRLKKANVIFKQIPYEVKVR